jgi:hypothetical protein
MDIFKPPVSEKFMDGIRKLGSYPEYGAIFIGSGSQMGNGS